jgi:hypothetical protein
MHWLNRLEPYLKSDPKFQSNSSSGRRWQITCNHDFSCRINSAVDVASFIVSANATNTLFVVTTPDGLRAQSNFASSTYMQLVHVQERRDVLASVVDVVKLPGNGLDAFVADAASANFQAAQISLGTSPLDLVALIRRDTVRILEQGRDEPVIAGRKFARHIRPRNLFQSNADALGAIQQSLEVEADQGIVGMQADQCGKRRHRRGITGLELSESFGILRDLWRLVGCCRQRLEGSELLAAPRVKLKRLYPQFE